MAAEIQQTAHGVDTSDMTETDAIMTSGNLHDNLDQLGAGYSAEAPKDEPTHQPTHEPT